MRCRGSGLSLRGSTPSLSCHCGSLRLAMTSSSAAGDEPDFKVGTLLRAGAAGRGRRCAGVAYRAAADPLNLSHRGVLAQHFGLRRYADVPRRAKRQDSRPQDCCSRHETLLGERPRLLRPQALIIARRRRASVVSRPTLRQLCATQIKPCGLMERPEEPPIFIPPKRLAAKGGP